LKERKKNKSSKPKFNARTISLAAVGVVLVGFLTWLIISVATADTNLASNIVFELPGFNSLSELGEVDGEYAVAINGTVAGGQVDLDELEARPTASTAKMILGLAIMRERPFNLGETGETITIEDELYDRYLYYVNHNGSNTKVVPGEEISEYDALVSIFLASSNNMADTLAIWAFGSLENYRDYAAKMLAEWGISHTTIGPDASGFDPATTSTPEDLAKIGYRLMQEPVLQQIVGLKEYEVPVAGVLTNTNKLLGISNVSGIKTGWIGDASGYCLVSGYLEGDSIVTLALLNAPTRNDSFDESLGIIRAVQGKVPEQSIISEGKVVAQYDSWWTGKVPIRALEELKVVGWEEAEKQTTLEMDGPEGILKVSIGGAEYNIKVRADEYAAAPSFGDRLAHAFGWRNGQEINEFGQPSDTETPEESATTNDEPIDWGPEEASNSNEDLQPKTSVPSENCTIGFGNLMLINPNFTVTTDFIDARRGELVSISSLYGIVEGNPYNGDNLLDPEAAEHINEMVKAYEAEYPGHTFETRSCYRARGTTCGRLCAATGTSDHHTGLTCDLLDPAYGTSLDTDTYDQHIDWQWLYNNSYKYGFIDRFPYEWAGGPMSEPVNVDENGSTGLFETWHYRYVGVGPATEIATGKYNNGKYDSLEHYLKARGLVSDLKNGLCK